MDTSDSGLDEPGDEQQTKRLELGTLPETIGEADLEKLNLALGFLFCRLREARAQFEQKGDNGRLGACNALGALWQFITLFRAPYAQSLQVPILHLRSQALSRIEWSRSFSRSSARDAPPQVMLMVA
jgi:hypothetical protein